jgi:4-hydroxyphenylacetate 3-monooxygenase
MRSGAEYVAGLRDGRSVFINGGRVDDVTTHPAFRGAVGSVARLYDLAHATENRDLLTVESPETGGTINVSYMIPRSEEDLVRRRKGLRRLAEETFGLMGRSPDHVAGFLAGFAARPDVFSRAGAQFGENVSRFYRFAAQEDLYVSYVIVPPQIDRSKPAHQQADPHLYAGVKEERDDGIVIAGAQMLGTGAVLSDFIQLSNIAPLGPGDENHAISVVVPVGAPGVQIISRRSFAQGATSAFDYPLSTRFDETDSFVVFEDVLVPWEHVFVYRDLDLVQAQWWETPAWLLGNTQAHIRASTKLDFLVGVAKRVAEMNRVDRLPPVQGMLGRMAAQAALVRGLVSAAEHDCRMDDAGVAWPGSAATFANSTLQARLFPEVMNLVRELCGGGLIQLPSSVDDFDHPEIAAALDRYVQSPGVPSRQRVQLMKLAWDLVGSEFASRQHQYEMFYGGAPFVTEMRMMRNYDFAAATALVDAALSAPAPRAAGDGPDAGAPSSNEERLPA